MCVNVTASRRLLTIVTKRPTMACGSSLLQEVSPPSPVRATPTEACNADMSLYFTDRDGGYIAETTTTTAANPTSTQTPSGALTSPAERAVGVGVTVVWVPVLLAAYEFVLFVTVAHADVVSWL